MGPEREREMLFPRSPALASFTDERGREEKPKKIFRCFIHKSTHALALKTFPRGRRESGEKEEQRERERKRQESNRQHARRDTEK